MVTETGSCLAAMGTVTVKLVEVAEVTKAFTLPNKTVLLPGTGLKLFPEIVTWAPMGANAGEIDVMIGGAPKTKPAFVPVPELLVTETSPEKPVPIIAVIDVEEFIVKLLAGTLPKRTAVAPVKLLPVMVTVAPVPPSTGLKDKINGSGFTSLR